MPDLGAIFAYLQEQAQYFIWIAMGFFLIKFGIMEQAWGKAVGLIAVTGFVGFIIGDPEAFIDSIESVWELVF